MNRIPSPTLALGLILVAAGLAGATDEAEQRAEAAATRAERAAERSEAAASRVDGAVSRLERLLEEWEREQQRRGRPVARP